MRTTNPSDREADDIQFPVVIEADDAITVIDHDDEGQTTAEYALVIAAAAAVVGGLIAWAQSGAKIAGLFNAVLDTLTAAVGG